MWLHGGSWCIGSARDANQTEAARRLCVNLSVVVVSVDYRLAPEHPWPAAPTDVHHAIRWLAADAAAGGVPAQLADRLDRSRVILGGESAGGNLALIEALRLLGDDAPDEVTGLTIAALGLVYPSMLVPEPTESHIRYKDVWMVPKWFTDVTRASYGYMIPGRVNSMLTELC